MTAADHTTDAEYLALHRRMLETPKDDAIRLIIADWLEEHGEDERAEFIRWQINGKPVVGRPYFGYPENRCSCHINPPCDWCVSMTEEEHQEYIEAYEKAAKAESHYYDRKAKHERQVQFNKQLIESDKRFVWSRGFVSEVRLTCREFCGGMCNQCTVNTRPGERYVLAGPESHWEKCETCSGTGRIPGVARELFERHPIVTVRLVDAKPRIQSVYGFPAVYVWSPQNVPEAIFRSEWFHSMPDDFDTEAAALDALSDACVNYARALVGLPPLEPS